MCDERTQRTNQHLNNYTITNKTLTHLNSTKNLGIISYNLLNFTEYIHERLTKHFQCHDYKRNLLYKYNGIVADIYEFFLKSYLDSEFVFDILKNNR